MRLLQPSPCHCFVKTSSPESLRKCVHVPYPSPDALPIVGWNTVGDGMLALLYSSIIARKCLSLVSSACVGFVDDKLEFKYLANR